MSDPVRRLSASLRSRFARVVLVFVGMSLLLPTVGAAMTGPNVTLNQDSGGQLTRFTFTATSDLGKPVESMTFTYPEGFDLGKVHTDVVTLEGLQRTPSTVAQKIERNRLILTFTPPVAPQRELRVQMWDVLTPAAGGDYTLRATYISGGQVRSIPDLQFSFNSTSPSETLSRSLDNNALAKAWNNVKVFNLFLKPQLIAISVPLLFVGWLMSIALVAVAFPLAIVGGLGLAFMKMSKILPVRWIASVYINVIRGTPLFLQIFIAFIGLPIAGIHLHWFLIGIIVLALNSSAYLAEIFRAGIQSISKGQFEAASSLGMTYAQAMRYVIIPQGVKRVLPTMTSEFILLFKDTALLSAVGVFELMLYANAIVARAGNLTPFVVAAVYYLIVTIPLINWVTGLEHRLAVSEGGQGTAEKKHTGLFGRFGGRGALTPPALAPGTVIGGTPEEHESR